MTTAEKLWFHQAQLLAASVRLAIRRGIKKPQRARQAVETAFLTTETLIWHLKRRP
jgi:hypothetical protein